MARIDLPEPYAVNQLRKCIKESLQSHGEECVLFSMYHVVADGPTGGQRARCPECWDDIYQQPSKYDCTTCYTSTFAGGLKAVNRAWGMFSDALDVETVDKQGVWTPDKRNLQTECSPVLMERDFVARVSDWTLDHKPNKIEGIYVVDKVTVESLRTGNRYGQQRVDIVGQKTDLTRLQNTHPIYKYPLLGATVPRFDGLVR